MITFSLLGAAGYVAPRHIRAIRSLGHELIYAFDLNDARNAVQEPFPAAQLFTDFSNFANAFSAAPTDYVVICSPNHVHAEQISWALQQGADVICEKPLVLHPHELDRLASIEQETGKKVYTVLQLRYLDVLQTLRQTIASSNKSTYQIELEHITPRNEAYFRTWKGNEAYSGGIVTNIGIHLFDLLIWIFGGVQARKIMTHTPQKVGGELQLEKANVRWFLSVDAADLPAEATHFYRKMTIDGQQLSLENGLETLHTRFYEAVLNKIAPGITDARPSIEFCNSLISSHI